MRIALCFCCELALLSMLCACSYRSLTRAVCAQVYGLPSFSYGDMAVCFFWRYRCPEFPCFGGGVVSSALAYSYDSRTFSAFGQPNETSGAADRIGRAPPPPPTVGAFMRGTDVGSTAYAHTYKHFKNATAGALACQAECGADSKCASWTFVKPGGKTGAERCCHHVARGCPKKNPDCISGARVAGPCVPGPPPPPPPPPPSPIVELPELFPVVNGDLSICNGL